MPSGLEAADDGDMDATAAVWRITELPRFTMEGPVSNSTIRRVLSHALIDIAEDAEICTPKTVCLEKDSPDMRYNVGQFCSQGASSRMEDRTLVADLTSEVAFAHTRRTLLLGVFDGHAGHEAADHLATTLQQRLLASPALAERDYGGALRDALLEAERHFMFDYFTSGTTALVVLMIDRSLYIANVGDCRAVVCDDSEARALTWDHKPTQNTVEKARLEASGAKLSSDGYIEILSLGDGDQPDGLALSRALGGAPIKQVSITALSNGNGSGGGMCAHSGPGSHDASRVSNGRAQTFLPTSPRAHSPFLSFSQPSLQTCCSSEQPELLNHCPSPLPSPSAALRPPPLHQRPHNTLHSSRSVGTGSTQPLGMPEASQPTSRQGSTILSESSVVIAEPELFHYSIHQGSEFLILASDGLWDKVRNAEAVARVRRWLSEDGQTLDEAAASLAEYSLKLGSLDNVSVLLLRFSSRPLQAAATPRHANSVLRRARSMAVMPDQQPPQPQPTPNTAEDNSMHQGP